MEIRFGIQEDGAVCFDIGPAPKTVRENKGKSLLLATNNYVSIDIETTGLSPAYDEIIEIGAVKYRAGEIVDTFQSLVNPEMEIDDFITQMTGITNEMLVDAPILKNVLPTFIEFVGKDILLGHNVNFDINFIYDACNLFGLPVFDNDFIDTMRLARRMYKNLPNHKLDTLISHFGLQRRELHRGLLDCVLTAECYQKMMDDSDCFAEAIKPRYRNRNRKAFSLKDIVAIEGEENPDSPLYGKVCVFTGTLESFTRKEAGQLVVNIGGLCADNITKKTNYLILGNNDYCKSIKDGKSNKQKKAEKLIADGADLTIIPEEVFLDILQMDYEEDVQQSPEETVSAVAPPDADEKELHTFECIEPILKRHLEEENLSVSSLYFKKSKVYNAQYGSVYLFNDSNLFCRINFGAQPGYFSISSKYENFIPEGVDYKKQKSDPNYCRIYLDNPEDIEKFAEMLLQLLDKQIDACPTDFACCSRFEACSDAKKCINPDPNMAIRCYYRKNLKQGKIFYGKNKTI